MATPLWIQQILKALEGIQDMMAAITFMQFIHEEAIQSAALGTFLALRHGSYRGASLGISQTRQILENLKAVNTYAGIFAPYSHRCFEDFIKATETNLEIYDDILMIKGKQKQ